MIYSNVYNRAYRRGRQLQVEEYATIMASASKFTNPIKNVKFIAQETKYSCTTIRKYLAMKSYQKSKHGNPHKNAVIHNLPIIARINQISWSSRKNSKQVAKLLYNEGVDVSAWQVSWIRKRRLNFSFRKSSQINFRQNLPIVQIRRQQVAQELNTIPPALLIVIDEVHFSTSELCETYCWLPKSKQIIVPNQRDNIESFSLIMAIGYNGVVYFHLQNVKKNGTIDKNIFFDFIVDLVAKIKKEEILFMDNATIHKSTLIETYLKLKKIRVVYNAPYSPEWSGIELVFQNMKMMMKKFEYSPLSLETIIYQVIQSVTDDLCYKCINHSYKRCTGEESNH